MDGGNRFWMITELQNERSQRIVRAAVEIVDERRSLGVFVEIGARASAGGYESIQYIRSLEHSLSQLVSSSSSQRLNLAIPKSMSLLVSCAR
jgi:hypothetical protein